MRMHFLALLVLTLAAPFGHAALFKWVDERGTTHYSETPPSDKTVKGVELPPAPSKETTEEAKRKLQKLLEEQRSRQGSPELLHAIEGGDTERALGLLRQGADPNTSDRLGRTALMYAGINGQTQVIMKDLMKRGADVNARSADGTTALIASVIFGDPDAVRLLLSSGADANARDQEGRTALKWAYERLSTAPADRSELPNWPERNQYGDLTFATKRELQEAIELLEKAGAIE